MKLLAEECIFKVETKTLCANRDSDLHGESRNLVLYEL